MDRRREEQMSRPDVDALAAALVSVSTVDEAKALMVDLCTVREIDDLAQRLEVARMLDAGDPYASVQKATGASSTTVSRVSKFLNGGSGGYRLVLDRMDGAR